MKGVSAGSEEINTFFNVKFLFGGVGGRPCWWNRGVNEKLKTPQGLEKIHI